MGDPVDEKDGCIKNLRQRIKELDLKIMNNHEAYKQNIQDEQERTARQMARAEAVERMYNTLVQGLLERANVE